MCMSGVYDTHDKNQLSTCQTGVCAPLIPICVRILPLGRSARCESRVYVHNVTFITVKLVKGFIFYNVNKFFIINILCMPSDYRSK